jgi:hypothetical protein
MLKHKTKNLNISLAVSAAVLYNIWPLGYLLDPDALHNCYFSSLEVNGKPYAWLFMLGDILTGIVVVAIVLIIRKLKLSNRVSLIGLAVFGLATLFDAIIPISSRCEQSISACGISLSQVLSIHDIASIAAAIGMFMGLLSSKRRFRRDNLNPGIYKWLSYIFWLWCIAGIFLIISVVIDDFTTISQALFLIAYGLGLVAIPTSIVKMKK